MLSRVFLNAHNAPNGHHEICCLTYLGSDKYSSGAMLQIALPFELGPLTISILGMIVPSKSFFSGPAAATRTIHTLPEGGVSYDMWHFTCFAQCL